jgi:aspartate aminotransferase
LFTSLQIVAIMTVAHREENLFDSAPLNPPDPIFGLIEQFKQDPNPEKINLSVGVYQDESGLTPVMECVRAAEAKILSSTTTKNYQPIDGPADYNALVGGLVFGEELMANASAHCVTAQTPGGTVSLRVAGELLRRVFGVDTIWISDPTWANHPQIFDSAGLKIREYDYLDEQRTGLAFDRLMDSLNQAQAGQAVLLHTVCHNPTGVDPSNDQWRELSQLLLDKRLFPIFDFAYQGFGIDLGSDAFPIRPFGRQRR